MDDETRGLWQVARHLAVAPGFMTYELARLRAAGEDPAAVLGTK